MRVPVVLALLALLQAPAHGAAQTAADLAALTLRSGDVIRVEIWREGELSGDFHVDAAGRLVVPLLGEFQAAGRPWGDLHRELLEGYGRELRNPSIRITPLRRVHVLGEVNAPGIYAVDPTLSLVGAIAMAGGTLPEGDLKNIRVIRDGATVLDRVPAESALAAVDVRSGDQVFVGRRGWFDRNSVFLATALVSFASIVVTLVVR